MAESQAENTVIVQNKVYDARDCRFNNYELRKPTVGPLSTAFLFPVLVKKISDSRYTGSVYIPLC